MEKELVQITDDFTILANPHPVHVFLITGKQVAKGYEVSPQNVREHKSTNSKEFVENKHFVVRNPDGKSGSAPNIFWTLRGVMRLGFLIKSENARIFRNWAEDTLFNTVTGNVLFRSEILKEKTNSQKLYRDMEKRLIENDDYLQLMKAKAAVMRTGKELKEMDKNIVNAQFDLFDN